MIAWQTPLVDGVYVVAILVFILGLRSMSSPATARRGIMLAGVAMFIAVAVSVLLPGESNFALIALGVFVGGLAGWYWARVVQMTAMPQMVAIFNGMGGGAAGAIAAVELLVSLGNPVTAGLSLAGAVIGSVSIAGSIIAFLKLQGWLRSKPIVFPGQQPVNLAVLVIGVAFGGYAAYSVQAFWLLPFFLLMILFGFLFALPIGGADMPVVISLFNAFTGIAVALDGFALVNGPLGDAGYALVVAGTLVGAAGSLLTLLMAKAMNRSVGNVLFGAFGATEETGRTMAGSMKPMEADDAAVMMAYANEVIIVPGYGMAVAQAQQKVKELADLLEAKGVTVKYAIHPVAGRMPGHMNVLLAEAGISYDKLFDRDEINSEFPNVDVALVIGANDVVNPAAHRQGSPLFGMPILDVDQAHNVLVIKRGQGKGFAGIENDLFYKDNTHLLYGDAQQVVAKLVAALKKSS
ncbi:MAG: NAD(P)(+) transhydrogenase (Re/Si-specific) subunit beta [Thermoplasmata archaeon]|jgi:H+-translocating NAD(P) transhydrogenase subunit beta|nr:NAD(P)(+) transhydrogenase (Re/Si-specific) subunit beta [Thermoplasmata archaeon]